MKKYLFLALGVAALTSCSSDEVTELNQGNEIKFSVVADNDSRAQTVYCNNNPMTSFKVYASANESETFINGDEYVGTAINTAWTNNEGTDRYWPETASLDFYAVVNAENGAVIPNDWENNATPTVAFTTNTTVGSQLDFLYAVSDNKTKAKNASAPVLLNFRHALSQIEFMAKNDNPNLRVVVEGVKVGKYYQVGTYTLPYTNTETNFESHDQTATHTHAVGSWAITENTLQDYIVEGLNVEVNDGDTKGLTLSLVDATDATNANYTNSMLLLPSENNDRKTTAWTPDVTGNEVDYDGTYLGVKCKIYNVVETDVVSETALLHDGWAIIPVSFAWEQGKKYIYTFNFTNGGNGGYEDTPEKPEPVLVPIQLQLTVDDFQKGEGSPAETPMETVVPEEGQE